MEAACRCTALVLSTSPSWNIRGVEFVERTQQTVEAASGRGDPWQAGQPVSPAPITRSLRRAGELRIASAAGLVGTGARTGADAIRVDRRKEREEGGVEGASLLCDQSA